MNMFGITVKMYFNNFTEGISANTQYFLSQQLFMGYL